MQNKFDWWKLKLNAKKKKFKYATLKKAFHPSRKKKKFSFFRKISLETNRAGNTSAVTHVTNLVLLIVLFTPRPHLLNVRNETIFNWRAISTCNGGSHPVTVLRNRAEFTRRRESVQRRNVASDRQWRPTLKRAKSLRRIEPTEERKGTGGEEGERSLVIAINFIKVNRGRCSKYIRRRNCRA